jgi:hypothetical protein
MIDLLFNSLGLKNKNKTRRQGYGKKKKKPNWLISYIIINFSERINYENFTVNKFAVINIIVFVHMQYFTARDDIASIPVFLYCLIKSYTL